MARLRRRPIVEPEPASIELGDLQLTDYVDPRALLALDVPELRTSDEAARLAWLRAHRPELVRSPEEARAHAERRALGRTFHEAAVEARRRGCPLSWAAFLAAREGEA